MLLLTLTVAAPRVTLAWGHRAHAAIDQAAVEMLPADGPVFLKQYLSWIEASATVPDSWRTTDTPFLKIEEDPNHGWFREQFAFMHPIPRSRYEFVLELYREYQKIRTTDPENAARMNVRWTGTLPYAAMEAYGRLVSAMRLMRQAQAKHEDTHFLEMDCAFYTFELGHYIGDGGQPLHDTIQHDGWQGPDPKGYTRDHAIHGRFESQYVEKIQLKASDIEPMVKAPVLTGDLFENVLAYLDRSSTYVDEVYELDKRHAFDNPQDAQARGLVYERTAAAAQMLRDMIYRAWLESATPRAHVPNPIDPKSPGYNPETGSVPPQPSPVVAR